MTQERPCRARQGRPGGWVLTLLAVFGAVVFLVPVLLLPLSTAVSPIV